MFEEYKKEVKKYDITLRLDTFFKIVFWIITILSSIILLISKNFWNSILIIILIEILIIIIGLFLFYHFNLKKYKSKYKKKNVLKRLKEYIKKEEQYRINFFKNLLKKYNINTKDEIYRLIELNKMQHIKLNLSETQSIFGFFVIFMTMASDYYDSSSNFLNVDKFGFGIAFSIMAIIICGFIKLFKFIIYNVLFSTKEEINSKFENSLLYFYLNFEEYTKELKSKRK